MTKAPKPGERVVYVGHTERCPHACERTSGIWLMRIGKVGRLVDVLRDTKIKAQIRFDREDDDCFARIEHVRIAVEEGAPR